MGTRARPRCSCSATSKDCRASLLANVSVVHSTQWVEHASALTATFVSRFAATHSLEDCNKAVLTELGSRLGCLTPVV